VIVRALPTGSLTSCDSQPPDSDIVHDHIWLHQHQVGAVAGTGVGIGTTHVQHTGTSLGREIMRGSSSSGELSPSGGSAEMVSYGYSNPNREVLVERIG
jgi:hypothetical protein